MSGTFGDVSFTFLGPDPLEDQVTEVLRRLSNGDPPRLIESARVDVKEEPGRRSGSTVRPGQTENDQAADFFARETACLANTAGGGAIVIGVADDGTRVGTELDPEWLRHRIWELTEHRLTVSAQPVEMDGVRLLVLTAHEAIEPIGYHGRYRWRVDDNCVEMDPTSWHSRRMVSTGFDWSAQPSGHVMADISPAALQRARQYLAAAGDAAALDLAAASDQDLVRRLNLVDGEGRLTNAGSLLFVGTPGDGIDYIRRDSTGGDSTARIRSSRPLIEQVWDVDQASQTANRIVHVPGGFAHGQMRAIPVRALREAIVNGVVHRDWLSLQPTTVEHIGDVVVVTSPGGFVGGVGPTNIITHPSTPRYRSLAEALAALRLAEREGIGVDRMVGDMLSLGRPQPDIAEVQGPAVRTALIGGEPDAEHMAFLALLPHNVATDLDALLIIDHLLRYGWVDTASAVTVLQRLGAEAEAALQRLLAASLKDGAPVIVEVQGVPDGHQRAYRLSDTARRLLPARARQVAQPSAREEMLATWAIARGRISTTEAADLTGLSTQQCGQILRGMEEQGVLDPGRQTRFGRGFFYIPRPSE